MMAQTGGDIHNRTSRVAASFLRAAMALALGALGSVPAAASGHAQQAEAPLASTTETVTRTLRIGHSGSFDLSNIAGDIVVRGGPGEEVRIIATKKSTAGRRGGLDAVDIDVHHSGDRVRVKVAPVGPDRDHHDSHRGHGRGDLAVDFEVVVPYETKVSARSVSGNVEFEDVRGAATAESVSGDVRVRDVNELELAKSVSGNVTVEGARSARRIEIGTVSGELSVRMLRAPAVDASTVSGDVVIEDARCERAAVSSVSGDVRFSGALAPAGRYDFQSHSGDVVLGLGSESGFQLEARTFSGEVKSDFSLDTREASQRLLRGTHGNGSALIDITTFSGDVRLIRR